jgi:hypothetical protein
MGLPLRGVGVRGLLASVTLCVLVACSSPPVDPAPGGQTPEGATLAELRDAIAKWHRTPASITYRTERQRPGLPVSAHQCLRAILNDADPDIPGALRTCDPAGVVTLAWDPPARWRIDVTEAGLTTTAIVVGNHGIVCGPRHGIVGPCRSRSVDAIARTFPFHQLIAAVGSTSQEAGIDAGGPITFRSGAVAGTPVRCYRRSSGAASVTWCFAIGGALLSLVLRTDERAPTIAEAERISDDVAATRFIMPT